eukprot:m.650901 g.650901  ORF g.650901 m.650901 type:complete len:108 (+) comp22673_c1_seq39:1220-1543(+)
MCRSTCQSRSSDHFLHMCRSTCHRTEIDPGAWSGGFLRFVGRTCATVGSTVATVNVRLFCAEKLKGNNTAAHISNITQSAHMCDLVMAWTTQQDYCIGRGGPVQRTS